MNSYQKALQEYKEAFEREVNRVRRKWVRALPPTPLEDVEYLYCGVNSHAEWTGCVLDLEYLTAADLEWVLEKRRAFEQWQRNELAELPPNEPKK